jgi:hypothetical protein
MANLLDWNTLDNQVKSYIDSKAGIDTRQKAFPILMVASILKISDEEAVDSITDGGKDRGVDAVFVDDRDGANSIHIFQFKYVDSFANTKKNFPSGETDKLISYFNDVLESKKSMKATVNPILWNKTNEIWDALDEPAPKINIHFCGNLEEMESSEKKRATDAFEKYKQFSVHHHSLASIVSFFIDRARPKINRQISAVDKDYFDRSDGNIRGLICSVEATEIVNMVRDPNHPTEVLGEIFNDNVRVYLSKNNKINKKIIESALSEESAIFWYLNNGITITCDSFSYVKNKRAPLISLENIQIVNGGQTTNALFEAHTEGHGSLENVLVLVRIIETKSEEISLAIAESTNSQTPIKGRDLRSNDENQKKLEMAFAGIGYFYERKMKQHQDQASDVRIDALEAGQAILAYKLGKPETAKKDRGRIFADLYDQIFTDEITADELLASYLLLRQIDAIKRQVQKAIREESLDDTARMFLIDGAYHVLYALYLLCVKSGIDPMVVHDAQTKIHQAITLVGRLVAREQKSDETFSFNRFFKDARTKNIISTAVKNSRFK